VKFFLVALLSVAFCMDQSMIGGHCEIPEVPSGENPLTANAKETDDAHLDEKSTEELLRQKQAKSPLLKMSDSTGTACTVEYVSDSSSESSETSAVESEVDSAKTKIKTTTTTDSAAPVATDEDSSLTRSTGTDVEPPADKICELKVEIKTEETPIADASDRLETKAEKHVDASPQNNDGIEIEEVTVSTGLPVKTSMSTTTFLPEETLRKVSVEPHAPASLPETGASGTPPIDGESGPKSRDSPRKQEHGDTAPKLKRTQSGEVRSEVKRDTGRGRRAPFNNVETTEKTFEKVDNKKGAKSPASDGAPTDPQVKPAEAPEVNEQKPASTVEKKVVENIKNAPPQATTKNTIDPGTLPSGGERGPKEGQSTTSTSTSSKNAPANSPELTPEAFKVHKKKSTGTHVGQQPPAVVDQTGSPGDLRHRKPKGTQVGQTSPRGHPTATTQKDPKGKPTVTGDKKALIKKANGDVPEPTSRTAKLLIAGSVIAVLILIAGCLFALYKPAHTMEQEHLTRIVIPVHEEPLDDESSAGSHLFSLSVLALMLLI